MRRVNFSLMSRLNVQPRTKRERKIRDTKKGENEYMGDLTRSLKRAEEKTQHREGFRVCMEEA